jgi:transposase-like protein
MRVQCPNCKPKGSLSDSRTISKQGTFRRKSDRKVIQRFQCKICKKHFSAATFDPCYRQLKRQFNTVLEELLVSEVSQRRSAYILKLNRKTIKRKFIFLGIQAKAKFERYNIPFPKAKIVEFDDMETFEHSKCKPLSITLAVEAKTRRILGFTVSQMPAKGLLSKRALKKYGFRRDERAEGRRILFQRLQPLIEPTAVIKSDQNPHYPEDVRRHFPQAIHLAYAGKRGAIVGQGELKKVGFDPIFSLNHTCAKIRGDVNRLIRRTWCTTKKRERLELHLAMQALYHNRALLAKKRV